MPEVNGNKVPFLEAIRAMEQRGVVLPEVYYGELQSIARQLSFSITGVASFDQLQAVKDSLVKALKDGQTFSQWQRNVDVKALGLPRHRLDNIFRTNIQSQYMAGKWEQFDRNQHFRPYLMYDAINDARVRPTHLAMDGIIRPINDPFWSTHSPPCGYRCRCNLISLTEKQAQARSANGTGLNKAIDEEKMKPDAGWDYSPHERLQGINQAVDKRMQKGGVLAEALQKQLANQSIASQQQLSSWVNFENWIDKVTAESYQTRNEFTQMGNLPAFVIESSAIQALNPIDEKIYISDVLARHGIRDVKNKRGAALSVEELTELPLLLDSAQWFYDTRKNNLIALFETNGKTGKAAIEINYVRKGEKMNAVVTTGVIDASHKHQKEWMLLNPPQAR